MRLSSLALLLLPLLVGCHPRSVASDRQDVPGDRIEAAAVAKGLVIDPASQSLTGSWARDTDHACILPPAAAGGEGRIGLLIDYGDGQGCAGSGTVSRSGDKLLVRIGQCHLTASFDGTRISFPADVSSACDALCTGRATLAAMAVDRLSESRSEAAMLRTPGGRSLCAG